MIKVKWLDKLPRTKCNVTWGIPWKKGELKKNDNIALRSKRGENKDVQSWPLAYWPDGSIKWSAQSAVFDENSDKTYEVVKTKEQLKFKNEIVVDEDDNSIRINTKK